MVAPKRRSAGSIIIQSRKSDAVFSADLTTNNELVDVAKSIPIFIFVSVRSSTVLNTIIWLEARTSWHGYVQRFCSVKRFFVKQIEVIWI